MSKEPKLEVSLLSQPISTGGHTVNVQIYRLEGEAGWALEVMRRSAISQAHCSLAIAARSVN
jgi:hypothetical protein